jgi:hypothetical protein
VSARIVAVADEAEDGLVMLQAAIIIPWLVRRDVAVGSALRTSRKSKLDWSVGFLLAAHGRHKLGLELRRVFEHRWQVFAELLHQGDAKVRQRA